MSTELGKAYVQIIPSAKGISGSISKILKPEATSAGKDSGNSLASTLVSTVKKVVATAAIGKAIGAAITEGANLEQSIGGVETLFKSSADTVQKYAKEAYRTVGVGANEYMENVTSFSASLLQSLGGDTAKAADVANMAMIDMGDNANKMGTNMEDIQNAYQGFAKQNYTMLDNLKLGYGGTKSEMERLLADAQELSGVEYDISNLSDVYEAIHVIQEEIGITGTTAKEAFETVTGSANAMKAAFKNVLGSLALGEGVTESMQALAETISIFVFDNLLPMIGTIFQSLPEGIVAFIDAFMPILMQKGGELINFLGQGVTTGIPMLLESLVGITTGIVTWVQTQLPTLLQAGVELITNLVNGFLQGLPNVITGVGQIINSLLQAFMEALPQIMEAGFQIISSIAQALIENGPEILMAIGGVLKDLISTIIEHLPQILEKGKEISMKIEEGINSKIDDIKAKIKELMTSLVQSIAEKISDFLQKGRELIDNLKNGITEKKTEILSTLQELIAGLIQKIVEKFGEFKAKGQEVINNIKQGISDKKAEILNTLQELVANLIQKIVEKFGEFKAKGQELMTNVKTGIDNMKGNVVNAGKAVIESVKTAVSNFREQFVSVGSNIISGIARGITQGASAVVSAARTAAQNALNAAKSFLGIKSPSRVFRDEVGKMVPEGMAIGIESNLSPVRKALNKMDDLTTSEFIKDVSFNAKTYGTKTDINNPVNSDTKSINLTIGGQVFKAFVDRISLEQNKEIELELAY